MSHQRSSFPRHEEGKDVPRKTTAGRSPKRVGWPRMAERILTLRELNRATLARQLLLPDERRRRPGAASDVVAADDPVAPSDDEVVAAVERSAGLQSQDSQAAAIGLWTRLPGLRREQLNDLLERRVLVKGTLMRATQHLVSAADHLVLRPALQPALTRWAEAVLRRRAPGYRLAELAAVARPFFAEPHRAQELRRLFEERYPGADTEALTIAVRVHLPLLQAPRPQAPWSFPGNPALVNAEDWLGQALPDHGGADQLVMRYLAAFGPARLTDVRRWSGLAGLGDELERLAPRLRRFRDEAGGELLDLAGSPSPAGDGPAVPLLLPAWDNTLLAYVERRRMAPEALWEPVYGGRVIGPAALLDGFVAATWALERSGDETIVVISSPASLGDEAGAALVRTGERLARFVAPEAARVTVRFDPAGS